MMGIKKIMETIHKKQGAFTEEELQFMIRFVVKTGDVELAQKMIDDFSAVEKDSKDLIQEYEALLEARPKWVEQIENLLVAIEWYQLEVETAANHLAHVLGAYGIQVSAEEIRAIDTEQIKEKVKCL